VVLMMFAGTHRVADSQRCHQHQKREQGSADPAARHGSPLYGGPTACNIHSGTCFDQVMINGLTATTITISGAGGDEIEAYLARPELDDPRGGVVVIHHMPGYDRASKEIARRFTDIGYDAICPNLYSREAPGADPDDAAAVARAQGGVPDDRLVGDVGGAAAHLRSLPQSNGKVGVIGYCSGGRQSVLSACNLDLDAAVDCYGAYVTGTPPKEWPVPITNLVDQLPGLRCPLLGLFGKDDKFPSPEQVAELDRILSENGKEHEFHSYDDTGHGFFAVDRPSYRVVAAEDGWQRIAAFYGKHLAS
jgi:carboxymethylenebutenolidase